MNNFQSIIDYTDKNRKTIAIMTLSYQDAGARGGGCSCPHCPTGVRGTAWGKKGLPIFTKTAPQNTHGIDMILN